MATISPARIHVEEINQVCIVVKDIQKTVESFWNILGIGPWMIRLLTTDSFVSHEYCGRPTSATLKVATVQLGPLEIELTEPIEGDSIYMDWIGKHGEGFHHLRFFASDVEKTSGVLKELGFPCLQNGTYSTDNRCQFAVFDIKPLRIIWEVSNARGTSGSNAILYPPGPSPQTKAKLKVKEIPQVAIAVKDIAKIVKNYWNVLGIGPWEIRDWGSHVQTQRIYHGKYAWASEVTSHVFLRDLDLELVQPVEGESVYQDGIEEHGEGIHHLKFMVDNIEETASTLAQMGFHSLQGGRIGEPDAGGGYEYIYIEPLHSMWEPVCAGKGGRPGSPTFYPPELAYSIEKTKNR